MLDDGPRRSGDLAGRCTNKRFFCVRTHISARGAIKFTHSCWSTVYALINTARGVATAGGHELGAVPQPHQRRAHIPMWAFSLLAMLQRQRAKAKADLLLMRTRRVTQPSKTQADEDASKQRRKRRETHASSLVALLVCIPRGPLRARTGRLRRSAAGRTVGRTVV